MSLQALRSYTDLFGWALLGINCAGEIECVTDNIKDLIQWDRADLHRQTIYNYLHNDDHHKFVSILQSMPSVWSRSENLPGRRLRGIHSRLLIKPNEDCDGDNQYRDVLISATLMREGEHGSYALCVIRREEDLAPATPQLDGASRRPLHQITFKLDLHGKILREFISIFLFFIYFLIIIIIIGIFSNN